ncbi:hypothetical protein ACTI_84960 [Actinoplanes sp. OR16]|nr:hypothetical protein ACTI_84960 [Actinoplanes sp. OR16]
MTSLITAGAVAVAGLLAPPATAGAAGADGVLVRTIADSPVPVERVRVHAGSRTPVEIDPAAAAGIASGTRVRLRGGTVTPLSSGGASAFGITGTHHVTVVPVYWATTSVPSGQPTTAQLKTSAQALDGYWNAATAGKIRVAVAKVTAWKKIASPASGRCVDIDALETAAKRISGSIGTSGRDHLIIYFPQVSGCGWSGLATLGAGMSGDMVMWLNGSSHLQTIGHEFGHNLGLRHSNGAACYNNAAHQVQVPLSLHCDVVGYDDEYDIMGSRATGYLSAVHLGELGLLPSSASRRLVKTSTVTLAPVSARSGLRQVVVPMGRRTYHLEYRTAVGLDAGVDDEYGPGAGVIVRYIDLSLNVPYENWGETQLVTFSPASERVALAAGESWSGLGMSFAVKAASSTGATVTITQPADVTAPTVNPKPRAVLRTGTVSTTVVPVQVQWGLRDTHEITGLQLARRLGGSTAAPSFVKLATWERGRAVTATANRSNTWLIKATDEVGNTGVTSGAATKVTLNKRPSKTYKGKWKTAKAASYLGGSEQVTKAKNASARFTVTTRSIGWIATKDKTRGKAAVYIDGKKVATINLYKSSRKTKQLVFTRSWSKPGKHTITIVNLSKKTVGVDGLVHLS